MFAAPYLSRANLKTVREKTVQVDIFIRIQLINTNTGVYRKNRFLYPILNWGSKKINFCQMTLPYKRTNMAKVYFPLSQFNTDLLVYNWA